MSRRRATAAPLLVVAIAFATLWAGAPAAIAADAGAVIVTITDRLDPAAIDVAPGTVVVWRNDDSTRHRVRAREAPARFDSGNLEPGDTFSIALADEGVYAYVDERNEGDPRYAGRITVSSSAGAQAPSPTATADMPTPDVPPPPGTEDPSTRAVDVAMLDRSFSPASVAVAAGGTVAWTNTSDRDHTVSFSDDLPGSDVLPEGGTFSQTFEAPGSFSYICSIHPEMTGTVTVSGSPAGDTGAATEQAALTVASLAGDRAPATASKRALPPWVLPAGVATALFSLGAARLRRRRRGRAS